MCGVCVCGVCVCGVCAWCMCGVCVCVWCVCVFVSSYDEELALAEAREREVKSRAGHRGRLRTDPKKLATWK